MRRAALKKQVRLYLLAEDWVIQFVLSPGVSGIRYGSKWRLLAEYAAAKASCVGCIAGTPRLAHGDIHRAKCGMNFFRSASGQLIGRADPVRSRESSQSSSLPEDG